MSFMQNLNKSLVIWVNVTNNSVGYDKICVDAL